MKMKKLLPLLAAASVGISSFAAAAVTASAIEETNGYIGTIYESDNYDNYAEVNGKDDMNDAYKAIGEPFGTLYYSYRCYAEGTDAKGSITYNIALADEYTFHLLVPVYDGAKYPTVYLNGDEVAYNKDDVTVYAEATLASGDIYDAGIISVEMNLSEGEQTISWEYDEASDDALLLGVVLIFKPDESTEPTEPTEPTITLTSRAYNIFTDNTGEAAKPFSATYTISGGTATVSGIKWNLTYEDQSETLSKNIDPVVISSDGNNSITFGLILYGDYDKLFNTGAAPALLYEIKE